MEEIVSLSRREERERYVAWGLQEKLYSMILVFGDYSTKHSKRSGGSLGIQLSMVTGKAEAKENMWKWPN